MAEVLGPGVDIVEVAADPDLVSRLRADHPGLIIAASPGPGEDGVGVVKNGVDLLVGDEQAALAAATGAALACSNAALAVGVRADGVLVSAAAAGVEREVLAGRAVLVDVDAAAAATARLAVTSVCAWLGARVFRTGEVGDTRQVLDMVASIRGTRPPARTRRGLA
jgi:hypothetical protein